jgi:hypothetical protein
MLFHQHAVIEFLVKEGNLAGVIYDKAGNGITTQKDKAENCTLGWQSYENCLLA